MMTAVAETKAPPKTRWVIAPAPVPRALIYEEWKGKPVYYLIQKSQKMLDFGTERVI
ncbi:MAG: hypothetical protein LH609_11145 [Rudanella sp.]|nr:hypothetical protein [Rudanella sp.]